MVKEHLCIWFIIKERNLPKNNNDLNYSLFNDEIDNKIQSWINKEKKSKIYEYNNIFSTNSLYLFYNSKV